jgi:Flp pilus assembly protein TadD
MCLGLSAGCATQPKRSETYALVRQAEEAYLQERWNDAATAYRELARLVPGDAFPHFRLGNCLARQMRLDEAADAYR